MATMNRNHNLEEISTDAFLGVDLLKYQTLGQKIILYGSLIIGMGINLWGNFSGAMDSSMILVFTMIPIMIGIIFGCNYNEDLSLIQYIRLSFSNSAKVLYSRPTEDLMCLRSSAERIRQEKKRKEQTQEAIDNEHRKSLYKMLAVAGIMVIVFIIILFVISNSKTEDIHHTVSSII